LLPNGHSSLACLDETDSVGRMLSSLTSSVQSFVQRIGIGPVAILAVLSLLVIAGFVAGIYQEAKLRKASQRRRLPRATSYNSDEPEIQARSDSDGHA
jgi:hypothetical protein